MPKRVFKSGASFFLGANITQVLLERGFQVMTPKQNDADLWNLRAILGKISFMQVKYHIRQKVCNRLSGTYGYTLCLNRSESIKTIVTYPRKSKQK
jgi:hypothetical protein